MGRPENCEGMFGTSEAMKFIPACEGGNSQCNNCPNGVVEAFKEKWADAHKPTQEETDHYNRTDWGAGRTLVGDAILLESLKEG